MTIKKEAVISKFVEALEVCPPEHVEELTAAMHAFLEGQAEDADMHLAKVIKKRRRKKKKRIFPGQDPAYIEHNLIDDSTADAIDTNYREFDNS